MQNKDILELRRKVYAGYDGLIRGTKQEGLDFPRYNRKKGWVYCTDDIEDEKGDINGTTYLLGRELSSEDMGNDSIGIIIRASNREIIPFEDYSGRGFRPIIAIPGSKGLVANLASLESNPEKLEGFSPEDIIGINFGLFPHLKKKFFELTRDEYLKFYAGRFSNLPIFF
jgi:hypothetical protein